MSYTKKIKNTSKKKVLGIDCSSSTIGWGLMSVSFNLLSYGYIKPLKSNKGTLIERLNDTFNKIQRLCDKEKPDYVAIEDIMLFSKGNSTAKTITILTAFNRVSALAAYQKTENIAFIPVGTVRKLIKNELNFDNRIGKTDMPNIIRKYLYEDFTGPLNKRNEVVVEELDMADGIAVAWAKCLEINEPV